MDRAEPHHPRHCLCARPGRRLFVGGLLAGGAGLVVPAWAREGVDVGPKSSLGELVPADEIEQAALQQYRQLLQQASAQRALATPNNPALVRLRAIARRPDPVHL